MKYVVLADIHGNLEALDAVQIFIRKRRLRHFMVLGDSVGYGANPNECLEWVNAHAELHVMGNHEAAVVHEGVRMTFSDWAREAIDWTAVRLRPELVKGLRELPYLQEQGPVSLAHGTLHHPHQFLYLLDVIAAQKSFWSTKSQFGFVGHSHIPCYFTEQEAKLGRLDEGVFELRKGERYLFNPGSVGQPRDGDPRLSFGIFDLKELTFEIVRLPYDNTKAAQKIRKEGLPSILADRLLHGR